MLLDVEPSAVLPIILFRIVAHLDGLGRARSKPVSKPEQVSNFFLGTTNCGRLSYYVYL